jgi:Rieske Fe-S protein
MNQTSQVPSGSVLMKRRELIVGVTTGSLLLTSSVLNCSSSGSSTTGNALKIADLKLGSLEVLPSDVVVGLDDKGVYAMSAVCTHQGCTLEAKPKTIATGLTCPCHASTFDGNGNVTRGPASDPLQHYQVTISADGSISVETNKPVGADVRVPLG